jgi:hypothetical protein
MSKADLKLSAFIVRPFGTKSGIDFEKVEATLIMPAMKQAGIVGSTTADILEAGNIRADMFDRLLIADIVIADLSIHNANVFYELGIRHALRDKKTYLIRCSKDEIPFDLKTDRYLSYDEKDPAATVNMLAKALSDTIRSDRQDSPVFLMLPKLEAQNAEKFIAIPNDFGEEAEIARVAEHVGKLALLADETDGFPWQVPALRAIGNILFDLKSDELARETWEKIRNTFEFDREANDRLATIYQRLAEAMIYINPDLSKELFAKSDLAIQRLAKNMVGMDRSKRAEIFSLKARNAKMRWLESWKDSSPDERMRDALQSNELKEAQEGYEKGFLQDLNHFYSGINALSMLTIQLSLAEKSFDIYSLDFESADEAKIALDKLKRKCKNLASVVQMAVNARKIQLQQDNETDPWIKFTEADLSCIVETNAAKVGNLYKKALQGATSRAMETAQRQLVIYQQLDVLPENIKAALDEFSDNGKKQVKLLSHYVLFTGHMIDKADRKSPRFPANKEADVRNKIKAVVEKEMKIAEGEMKGISGGACGGDILFHEVCAELGIETEMYLALPPDEFKAASVAFAGNDWINRFNALFKKIKSHQLCDSEELPKWLQKKPNYNVWMRNNLWELNSAMVNGGLQMTLIALWDGKGGDGAGGTEHMVNEAKARGAKVIVIDMNSL